MVIQAVYLECESEEANPLLEDAVLEVNRAVEEHFDAGLLSNHFVGERVSEGYGEIQVEETADTADVYVWKDTELSPSSDIERAEDCLPSSSL